jgi:hypothetical protein
MLWGEDYPFGFPPELAESFIQSSEQSWGTGADAAFWAPSRANDAVFCRWLARYERGAWSPASYGATFRWVVKLDLRSVLPAIRVPTLILHRESGLPGVLDQGRYLAEHIPGARLVVVPGSDFWFFERADEIVDLVEEFLTGQRPLVDIDRVLATVLFTDIVGSTDHAARLGDRRWREVHDAHDNIVRRLLDQFRGQEIKTMGDGFLATFDGPARSLRCACAVRDAVRSVGIEVRAGLHTGEVEMAGGDVAGRSPHRSTSIGPCPARPSVGVSDSRRPGGRLGHQLRGSGRARAQGPTRRLAIVRRRRVTTGRESQFHDDSCLEIPGWAQQTAFDSAVRLGACRCRGRGAVVIVDLLRFTTAIEAAPKPRRAACHRQRRVVRALAGTAMQS